MSASLIERMLHLQSLRAEYDKAGQDDSLPAPLLGAVINAYIEALEDELEKCGVLIIHTEG